MDIKHIEPANSPTTAPSHSDGKKDICRESIAHDAPEPLSFSEHSSLTNAEGFALLPPRRKNLLFAVLTVAIAIDTLGTSSLFVSTEEIARDMGLSEGGNAIWIISAYAMAFAACIPLGGRLCDVLPAQWPFIGGFVAMTGLTMGNSFGESPRMRSCCQSRDGPCLRLFDLTAST